MFFCSKWGIFLGAIFLYGFKFTTIQERMHKDMLRNHRLKKFYIKGIKGTARPFKEIEHLKKHLGKRRVIRTHQTHKKIPVFGSRVIDLYFGDCNKCKVMTMGRRVGLSELSRMGTFPIIPREHSLDIAEKKVERKFSRAKLVIYPTEKKNYLAWMVDERSSNSRWRVFVDADEGKVIDYYDNIAYAEAFEGEGIGILENEQLFNVTFDEGSDLFQMISLNPSVETYKYRWGASLPGEPVTSSSGTFNSPSAIDAHAYTQKFLRFLYERFGRSSFDNAGAPIINTIGYYEKRNKPYVNAKWNGEQIIYGAGDEDKSLPLSGALDILVHEIAHAITEKTSELIYRGESGALNEAFSDIMATYVEHKLHPADADWKIGEDVWTPGIFGDAIRYMNNPTLDGVSRDHYKERFKLSADNEGVHFNSGIANLAFYLLVEGGVHPRIKKGPLVRGVGMERAIDIFYKAFTDYLPSSSRFIDARDACVEVAREYDRETVVSVMQAWAVVGIGRVEGVPSEGAGEVLVSHPNLEIPDKDRSGIEDVLRVEQDVRAIAISVDIKHRYPKDLSIKVFSPNSTKYVLHRSNTEYDDPGGASKYGIQKTYEWELLDSDSSVGDWRLKVSDLARGDTGVLRSWSISLRK